MSTLCHLCYDPDWKETVEVKTREGLEVLLSSTINSICWLTVGSEKGGVWRAAND